MTHSLKLCRSLRRMSPMYSQAKERRTVKKSRPNHIYSHCKGAGEKLTADSHFQLKVPNRWQLKGLPARCWAALLCQKLLPYLREIFFLGRESPFPPPPAASERSGLLSLLLPFMRPLPWTSGAPIPTPPGWFSSCLWGTSSSGSYTGSGRCGPRRSSSWGTWPW